MADDEAPMIRSGDPAIEAAALIFEARLIVEAVAFGLGRLVPEEGSPKLAAELRTLLRMTNQGGDALEALQKTLLCAQTEGNG